MTERRIQGTKEGGKKSEERWKMKKGRKDIREYRSK